MSGRSTWIMAGLLTLAAGMAGGGEAGDVLRGFNVRDFGAVGDGVADDTRAIQKALNTLGALSKNNVELLARQPMTDGAPELGDLKIVGSTSEQVIVPELYFPAGTYRLTDTLVARAYTFLRGEDGATLRQDHPEKDLLYWHWGFRVQLRNLTFEGGRRQVLFYTGNNDTANVSVQDCVFRNASGPAIWSFNLRRPGGKTFSDITMGAYEIAEGDDGPFVLTPNDESGPRYNNSTNLTFARCLFDRNRQVAHLGADGVTFQDCQVVAPADVEGPVFNLSGEMRLYNTVAVAEASAAARHWIAMRGGRLAVEGGSYLVEGGGGMALVRYNTEKRGEIPITAILRDVRLACGGSPEGAAIYIEGDNPASWPYFIDCSGLRETTGRPAAVLGWETDPTRQGLIDSMFDLMPAVRVTGGRLTSDWTFGIAMQDNGGMTEKVPAVLEKSRAAPLPPTVVAEATVFPTGLDARTMAAHFPRRLRAVDFGVDADKATDDTEAMQRVLAAADDGAPAVIELPPVLIRLSAALPLPPEVAFDAPGLATLRQTDLTQPIFEGGEQKRLWLRNLRLVSGRRGVDVATRPAMEAEILVETCFFYQQLDAALSVVAGDGTPGLANGTRVKVNDCTFISPVRGLATNAAHAEIDSVWISSNGRQDRCAFIDNRGGAMRVRNLLGVPMPMKDHKYNHLPFVPDWPYANDLRWFDNHGRLDIRHSRFGGEYYGIPAIYHLAAGGTVLLEGGFTCFNFPGGRQCLAYFAEAPRLALFRDSGWHNLWPDAATFKGKLPAKDAFFTRNFLYERKAAR